MRKGFLIGFCFLLLCCSSVFAITGVELTDSDVHVCNYNNLNCTTDETFHTGDQVCFVESFKCLKNCTNFQFNWSLYEEPVCTAGTTRDTKLAGMVSTTINLTVGEWTYYSMCYSNFTSGRGYVMDAYFLRNDSQACWDEEGSCSVVYSAAECVYFTGGASNVEPPDVSPGGGSLRKVLEDYNPMGYDKLDAAFNEWVEGRDVDHFFVSGFDLLKALIAYVFKQPGSLVPAGGYGV